MMCRNLPHPGLRNGTRLIIKAMHEHVIEAEIVTGSHAGERTLIPRLRLTPSETGWLHPPPRLLNRTYI